MGVKENVEKKVLLTPLYICIVSI